MSKVDVLHGLSFGQRVAEDEGEALSEYFVETDQWRRLYYGDVEVVYGPTGSGKSALYALLLARESALFDRSIILATAENPRGTPVFNSLVTDPPASEHEFVGLWKLYFVTLIADIFEQYDIKGAAASNLRDALEQEGLARRGRPLRSLLRAVKDYVTRCFRPASIEAGANIDPQTGLITGLRGKITFEEPSVENAAQGVQSIDQLLDHAEEALEGAELTAWILLDRLDVAFAESPELETNALRALFRVYRDCVSLSHLHLKNFLRTDIWRRITEYGFREASHITRHLTIKWDRRSLLNLIVRRAIQADAVQQYYEDSPETVLASSESQEKFFYRMFPPQVEIGRNKSRTFDWMLGRTRDGAKENAPRELIHLLNCLQEQQVHRVEVGDPEPAGSQLFTPGVFKEALLEVSRARLEQTLFAEYPGLQKPLEELRGGYTQQTIPSLGRVWGISLEEAADRANNLVQATFFELRGSRETPEYWVPFLYRDALDLIQGAARQARTPEGSSTTEEFNPPVFAESFSPRELELLGLLARGMNHGAIAEALAIHRSTVLNHLSNIFSKMGARTSAEAVAYAFRHGLVRLEEE